MEITLLIMEKSWNCVFEFLWEPCQIVVLYKIFGRLFMAASICAILNCYKRICCYNMYNEMLKNALAVLMHKCVSFIGVSPLFID